MHRSDPHSRRFTSRSTPKEISVWRPVNLDQFLMGVPHYPEHVDETYWKNDARRMAEAGFNVVRMGEFAWHIWEPEEGRFDFDLFDRAIEGLAKHGIATILCTPTATPPRWLTAQHPDVLRVDDRGRLASHGSRQHCDTTSPVLRSHSRRITQALADHYADNRNVIGWQTDNELNTTVSTSFSESCAAEFRKWCATRYGDIAHLNAAWGGDFWATHYDSFEQVVLPLPDNPGYVSPGHRQDYHRFLAHSVAAFQRDQVEILRAANDEWFIFHNLGRLDDIDWRGDMGRDLDFYGIDVYPLLNEEMNRRGSFAYSQALYLDTCRAFAGNFIVPEQASGLGSQPQFATLTPEPGEMRRMAMSSVARGADGLMFFRWRPAHFGAEIYWMGLIDHDDRPRRRYAEAKQFATDIAALKDDLLGTSVRMDVGIAGADFDNQEAYRTYPMGLPSPVEDATHLHRALYERNIACGFIHPEDDLSRLRALYIPHWIMWDDGWTERLTEFAQKGGLIIASALTGTRTRDNHVVRSLPPANGLGPLLGVQVEEFGRLAARNADGLFDPKGKEMGFGSAPLGRSASTDRKYEMHFGHRTFQAEHLYEKLLLSEDTRALAHWSNRWLSGTPVLSKRPIGKGFGYYLGTYLTEEIANWLIDQILLPSGVSPLLDDLPDGVEVTERIAADGRRLVFVLNTSEAPVELHLPLDMHDLLTGAPAPKRLEGYGCAVLKNA